MNQVSENRTEWKWAVILAGSFFAIWWMPVDSPRFQSGVDEAFALTRWYAREHVVLCLLPAFFIAGAVASFISKESVMKYLGPGAKRIVAYGVASVAGLVLTVCSCTVLPLFAGIYRMGAGLGPATAFLYSGPAVSVLAIVMSAKVLGLEMGLSRGIGAIIFSIVIGLCMAVLFRKDETERSEKAAELPVEEPRHPLRQVVLFFVAQVSILVFANWSESNEGIFSGIYQWKWWIVGVSSIGLAWMLGAWFEASWKRLGVVVMVTVIAGLLWPSSPLIPFSLAMAGLVWIIAGADGEIGEWWRQTWDFTKQVMPLLLGGVFVAGLMLGRPGHEAWVPSAWIEAAVGGDGILPPLYASLAGALMYFSTLTEIPIVEGLQGAGMKQGTSLALLLADPALSLPSILVILKILGWRKMLTYIILVVIFSTFVGWAMAPILDR